MSEPNEQSIHSDENEPIEVELGAAGFRIQAKIEPKETDPPPNSWAEVWTRVNLHLMVIAESIPAIPAVSLLAIRSIVKGIGKMPAALGSVIRSALVKGDTDEAKKQEKVLLGQSAAGINAHDTLKAIEDFLQKKREEGLVATIISHGEGKFTVISSVLPEHQHAAREAGAKILNINELGDDSLAHLKRPMLDVDSDTSSP